MNYHQII